VRCVEKKGKWGPYCNIYIKRLMKFISRFKNQNVSAQKATLLSMKIMRQLEKEWIKCVVFGPKGKPGFYKLILTGPMNRWM
jgi:hypothetical protein